MAVSSVARVILNSRRRAPSDPDDSSDVWTGPLSLVAKNLRRFGCKTQSSSIPTDVS